MDEIKIQIPDDCELIKDGDTYIVKKKKQRSPRSWEEFCEKYPIREGEAIIDGNSSIMILHQEQDEIHREKELDKNCCTSKEEAEAFLALMQLRQLRKAWVGDWKMPISDNYGVIYCREGSLVTGTNFMVSRTLSFPSQAMAVNFLNYFRDLCETAKILL